MNCRITKAVDAEESSNADVDLEVANRTKTSSVSRYYCILGLPDVKTFHALSDSGTGRRGRPRRREQSEDRDEENFNRRDNFRGSSAKAQTRTETGQSKKTKGKNDDDDYEDDEDDGRGRGGNRSGAGGQGSTARSLPRTESGQFKKKGERDELGERENSDRGKLQIKRSLIGKLGSRTVICGTDGSIVRSLGLLCGRCQYLMMFV